MHEISKKLVLELFKKMALIRETELLLVEHYKMQEMRTPVHFGLGQEGAAVGVCAALDVQDVIYTHHRSHNHYLAKGGDLDRLIAELYGRADGCSRGRGGSVHLTDRSVGVIATSAILAQLIPVATGSALAFKMDKMANVSVSFFGDGSLDEGVCYEAFNFASLHKLPVIFVCENNYYSTETKLDAHKPKGTEYVDRTKSFGIESFQVDGNDVLATYNIAKDLVRRCKSGEGPFFLELFTYRWLEHVGPFYDHEANRNYRSKEEVEAWQLNCPLTRLSKYLNENKLLTFKEQESICLITKEKVKRSINKAQSSAWPNVEDMMQNVY